MELKHHTATGQRARCGTFNRTTMELKLQKVPRDGFGARAFNRTTMELKRQQAWPRPSCLYLLLIEPLWN